MKDIHCSYSKKYLKIIFLKYFVLSFSCLIQINILYMIIDFISQIQFYKPLSRLIRMIFWKWFLNFSILKFFCYIIRHYH